MSRLQIFIESQIIGKIEYKNRRTNHWTGPRVTQPPFSSGAARQFNRWPHGDYKMADIRIADYDILMADKIRRFFADIYPDHPDIVIKMCYEPTRQDHVTTKVAYLEEDIVGQANIFLHKDLDGNANLGFHVHPSTRRRGIANILFRELEWEGAIRLLHAILGLPKSLERHDIYHAYIDANLIKVETFPDREDHCGKGFLSMPSSWKIFSPGFFGFALYGDRTQHLVAP